jgi:hypothetical protein
MKRYCLAIALAFVAALASDSWGRSQREAPPKEESKSAQQPTQNDQRGTDQSPFIIRILPTPKVPEVADSNGAETDSKSSSDWWLVKLTGALAAIGFLQLLVFGWQGIQLRNTVKASESEFTATHRPKIRVKHLWITSDIWDGHVITVNVTYVNNGTTNVVFNDTGIRFVIVRNDRLIPFDPKIKAIPFKPPGEIECGRSWEMQGLTDGTILTPEQNVEIQQGRSRLLCIGYVSYLDAAKRMRITGFCRVMEVPATGILAHQGNVRFRRFPDDDYEYED